MPIVFPVWKATTTTILEVEREQLLYSCYTNSKWAVDIYICVLASIPARADSITTVIMQSGTEYKLCEVSEAHMCVGHKRVTIMTYSTGQGKEGVEDDKRYDVLARTYSVVFDKGYSREYKVEKHNIYETASSQQIHTYTNAMEQCRDVDEQVGITMTHLAYCWDGNKQMQIVVRGQGLLDKAT
jgi:hypothetical protein